ncbi:MAG TPA: toxin TcdB middle/N-terminal domain-containing protein [Polyangia bacterium]|jgi:RHS repeat-associated protein
MRHRQGIASTATTLLVALALTGSAPPAAAQGSVDSYYGSFATEVPIAVPEFHGLAPDVKLVYSSTGGNGMAGVGWSVTGSSYIARASAGKGVPRYDGGDIFFLDGQELVPCGTLGGTHCTKMQSFQRITWDGGANAWYVWRKDGTKATYTALNQTAQGTFRWALARVQDPRGNAVTYGYWCDGGNECYLETISYNGTTITFFREGRPDPVTYAIGGSTTCYDTCYDTCYSQCCAGYDKYGSCSSWYDCNPVQCNAHQCNPHACPGQGMGKVNYRLRSIFVWMPGVSHVRAYRLSYGQDALGQSLLTNVQQYGRDVTHDGAGLINGGSALPATSMGYESGGFSFAGGSMGWPTGGYVSIDRDTTGDQRDGGIAFADFNGDGKLDIVWSMWECSGWFGGGCAAHNEILINTGSGFVPGPSWPTSGYLSIDKDSSGNQQDGGVRLLDLNGDGKTDIVWSLYKCNGWYGSGCAGYNEVWLSTGNGFVRGPNLPTGGYVSMDKGGGQTVDGGVRFADINGDGLPDLVWSMWECTGWYGDGCQAHNEIWLNTGNGWTPGPGWPTSGYISIDRGGGDQRDGGVRLVDMNGDGKADVVWSLYKCNSGWYGAGCAGYNEIWLSTGSGWVAGPTWPTAGYVSMDGDSTGNQQDGGIRFADINGDGKMDIVWSLWECRDGWYGAGCSGHNEIWLNAGNFFTPGPAWPSGGYMAIDGWNGYVQDGGMRLVDLNGDGKADLVWSMWECTGWYGAGCQAHNEVWLSTGTGFASGPGWPTAGYIALDRGNGEMRDGGIRFVDINGDGKQDLVWSMWKCNGWFEGGCAAHNQIILGAGGRDLMTSMTNNAGGTTDVTYVPSTAWANTAMPAGLVLQTVASVRTGDGRTASSTASYRYEGGLWSNAERRFLGFRKVTAVLDAAGNYTETYYHQHVGCISKPEATYFRDAAGNIFSYSTYGYQENGAPPYTSLLTDRWDYECNQSGSCKRVVTQLGYDGYGNATTTYEYGDYDASGDERTAVRGYYPNWGSYIVGLAAYENVYAGIGTGGELVKQSLYEYDANTTYAAAPTVGNMARVKMWDSSTSGYSTTSSTYDQWGNRISQTDQVGNTTTFSFDPTYHLYNMASCSPLGHCSSRSWDAVLGVRSAETDVNGYTTTWAHDAFGRVTQETLANGNVSTHQYLDWGNPSYQRTRSTIWDGTSDGQWEETYQDGIGRKYRVAKKAPAASPATCYDTCYQTCYDQCYDSCAGTYYNCNPHSCNPYSCNPHACGGTAAGVLTKDTIFSDASSRVWKQSAWYAAGETPKYELYAYDGAGRLRTVTHPDGAAAQRYYGNGYVLDYDELGHERVVWKDAFGRVSQIRERNAGAYAYTTKQFDVLGRLLRQVDAAGNVTTAAYDSLGRKYSECTPDTGCTSYAYDAAGRLLRQTDAKGQTITHTYDALNRIKTRATATENAVFTYDEAGYGASKGHLTTVTTGSTSESNTYDFAGRVVASTRCVAGICYTIGRAYDAAGRLASVTYPDGEVVTYGYDATSRLTSVSGYVTSMTYDARGHLVGAAYANGTTGSFAYDANRQWLTSAAWNGPAGALFQASYGYDADAHLVSMASTTNPLATATFGYDELNRLTSVSGGQSHSFAYDWLGNITSNSAVGAYAYGDAAHRHAVTAAGTNAYAYDANGNMVSGAGRTIAWDAHNRPVGVTKNGQTTTYAYDALGARVMKSGPAGTSYYFGSLLEVSGGSLVKYYFAGPMLVAKRDATGPYWYHQDHLSSVRVLTNASGLKVRGYDFAPYGEQVATSGATSNTVGWGGHRLDDESGLVYMNARYYDPQLGRFLSADSVVPDEVNPQALNRYAFAYNNPISNTDPTGHVPVVAAIIVVATVAASTAPAWVLAVAVIGAACTIAGYVLKDPLLMTLGSIALGFAGGFVGGAGFLAGPGMAGGIVSATVAAITSPLSPLDPGIKQAIGWIYTAQGLIFTAKKFLSQERDLEGCGGAKEGRSAASAAEAKAKVDQLLKDHPGGVDAKLVYGDIMSSDTATKVGLQHSTVGLYDHQTGEWLGEIGGNPGGSGLYLGGVEPGHANYMWSISNVSKDQLYRAIDAAYSVRDSLGGYGQNWVCHNVAARISRELGKAYDWSLVGGGEAAWAEFGYGRRYWGWNWSAGSGLNALLMLGKGAAAVQD